MRSDRHVSSLQCVISYRNSEKLIDSTFVDRSAPVLNRSEPPPSATISSIVCLVSTYVSSQIKSNSKCTGP